MMFAARAWCGLWGYVLLFGSEMSVRAFDEDMSSYVRQMKSVIWATLGLLSASCLGEHLCSRPGLDYVYLLARGVLNTAAPAACLEKKT